MKVSDVVWLQTGFIGDLVLTTAAFALVRQVLPSVAQHVITTPVGREVYADSSLVDSLTIWDKRRDGGLAGMVRVKRSLETKLRGAEVITLRAHPSLRSAFLAKILGFPVIAHRESRGAGLARWQVERVAVWHEAQRLGLLLEPLGAERQQILAARPQLSPLSALPDAAWARAVSGLKRPRIGIAPGSVWGTKRWPAESYSKLIGTLLQRGYAIVGLGAPDEKDLVEAVFAPFQGHPQLYSTAGQTRIQEMRWLLPQLDLIVANDSSPIHFAAALGIPTVAIFGATVAAMGFGPLATPSAVVEDSTLACRPCSLHGPQRCPLGHFRCMRELQVERVLAAVESIMALVQKPVA